MILTALTLAVAAPVAAGPIVRTDAGAVRGEALARHGGVFRGIRFARPPVGPLRWKPPLRPLASRAVVDATADHKACPQPVYGDWNRTAAQNGSEDCLFVDVRTPDLAARLPVLVWIHGGGNRAGAGNGTVESRITDAGIVLVSVQYRLGALGFLSHRALTAEQGGASGNYGILDQQLALDWVRRNIARFGGDPRRVTIAGESAGAQDVGLHFLSPGSRGLFTQGIEESGTAGFGVPPRSLRVNERLGQMIVRQAGAASEPTATGLRSLSVAAIVAAQEVVDVPDLDDDSFIWLQAVVDGRVLKDTPARLLSSGHINPARLIIGVNARELTLHGGSAAAEATIRREFGGYGDAALRFYRIGQGRAPIDDSRLGDMTIQLADDLTFRCPANVVARTVAAHGAAVWQYHFDFARPGNTVSHASETGFVFDPPRPGNPPLQAYWTNFVKTGDPNGAALPRWPRYDVSARSYLTFTQGGPRSARRLRDQPCAWRSAP